MTASLTGYKGLEVVTPDPTEDGGLAIQNNFKKLADWQVVGVMDILNAPPGSPVLGDRYLVGASPSGAWAGHANEVAEYDGSVWQYSTPQSVFDASESRLYLRSDQTSPIQADAEGNARGAGAVDLQGTRSLTSHVASGSNSVIAGGASNRSSGTNSVVGGGSGNVSSNTASTVAGGSGNSASALYSTVAGGSGGTASFTGAFVGGGLTSQAINSAASVVGGVSNTASKEYSSVGGGNLNTASGLYATVPGGLMNTASGATSIAIGSRSVAAYAGQLAHGSGNFATVGDAQRTCFVMRGSTTVANGTTPVELVAPEKFDGLQDEKAYACIVTVAGRQDTGANHAMYRDMVMIQQTGSTVSLVGTVQPLASIETDSAWGASLTADNTAKGLSIKVNSNSQNVRWVATIEAIEIAYAD